MGAACATKRGDHAGSLIASMAIDLATKSSPEFEYTDERSSLRGLEYFRAIFTESTCCERSSILYRIINYNNAEKAGIVIIEKIFFIERTINNSYYLSLSFQFFSTQILSKITNLI